LQKITFQPMAENLDIYSKGPITSKSVIPKWYKDTPLYVNGEKEPGMHPNMKAHISNGTLKTCVPFLDALTSGYVATLPCDIEIRKIANDEISIRWSQLFVDIVQGHHIDQTSTIPLNNKEYKYVSKWLFDWKIITPPGYSTFYTHPLNRHDLPFRTFSGVVDTDVFPDSVHFPFQILPFEGERIIIPEGTPFCQFFPLKRENWESEKIDYVPKSKEKAAFSILKTMYKSYKTNWWHKKSYN
jgi:hypothetical protein